MRAGGKLFWSVVFTICLLSWFHGCAHSGGVYWNGGDSNHKR